MLFTSSIYETNERLFCYRRFKKIFRFYSKEDNKATYLYGEKEIKYIHSVESKNHIAIFFYSPREDGYESLAENIDSDVSAAENNRKTLMKLDKISLYVNNEKLKYALSDGALDRVVPIQTVIFNYDYSLCENYYKGKESKIPIICHKKFKNGKEHGLFWMSVENHAKGCCCPKCRMSKLEQEVYNILSDNKITFLTQYHNKDILILFYHTSFLFSTISGNTIR